MSIRPLRPDQQELLFATLETATALSKELGPDAAIAKAAKQHGLPQNLLQYTVNAYNTGESLANIKTGSTREERAADVPLASLDNVINHIYPGAPVKKAAVSNDYRLSPKDLLAPPVVKKAAVRREALPSLLTDEQLVSAVHTARQQMEMSKSAVNQELYLYKRAQKTIQAYLDNQMHMRLEDVIEQSTSAFGDLAKVVLEPLEDSLVSHKRASRNQLIRVDREPFLLVKSAINQLEKLYDLGMACGAAEERMKASIKEAKSQSPALMGYLDALERTLYGPAPKTKPEPEVEPVNKQAFLSGKALLGDVLKAPAEMAATIGGGKPAQPKPAPAPNKPAEVAPVKLKPPGNLLGLKQQDEVGSLNKSVALNNLLASDPDLAGYDRKQLERAYNEIQTSYPRVAGSTAALRPFLQRHLSAGGLDEFALKNLADQEVRLSQTQNPQGAQ